MLIYTHNIFFCGRNVSDEKSISNWTGSTLPPAPLNVKRRKNEGRGEFEEEKEKGNLGYIQRICVTTSNVGRRCK